MQIERLLLTDQRRLYHVPNKKLHPDLILTPMLLHESVYVGIDIGEAKQARGWLVLFLPLF
ncbi:MAG TPA: hypothetical protein VHZ51_31220 [Ktedonobacteraceae bacterium]|nr:hypothetical protein [Ktedonobacteraceae bacterium]